MSLIAGKYQLIRKLATGGMAEVFLAKVAGPRGFEKTLVLKCILPHLAQEPSFVDMFHVEATLAARLSHPNIVQIFDFGEADGAYFLAMEYIDGPSLRTLIKTASAQGLMLPAVLCARFISQACEGLAFAHDVTDSETGKSLGLIHRDISPDNLLLTRQGTLKVVDFGIAKATGQSHKTEDGVIKGKLAYMPPEQLHAKPLDRRADVYSLGVVLYELLTSHKPLRAESEAGLMQAILVGQPVSAAHYRPDLPGALLKILDRAMAKDREQRYPDCHTFQSDLEEFIHSVGKPVTAQQVAQFVQQLLPEAVAQQGPSPSDARTTLDTVAQELWNQGQTRSAPSKVAKTELDTVLLEEPSLHTRPKAPETPPPQARGQSSRPLVLRVSKELALAGGALLSVGVGLVAWQALTVKDAPSSAKVALAPAPPVPAVPTPPAASNAQSAMGGSGGAGMETTAPPERVAPPVATPVRTASRTASSAPKRSRAAPRPGPPVLANKQRLQAQAMGKLDVRANPYALVFVDGQYRGQTPVDVIELPPGSHTVRLENPRFKPDLQRIEVKPGESVRVTAHFSSTD